MKGIDVPREYCSSLLFARSHIVCMTTVLQRYFKVFQLSTVSVEKRGTGIALNFHACSYYLAH